MVKDFSRDPLLRTRRAPHNAVGTCKLVFGIVTLSEDALPFRRREPISMVRSSAEFISIRVRFAFKCVFDPVRGVYAVAGVCECATV